MSDALDRRMERAVDAIAATLAPMTSDAQRVVQRRWAVVTAVNAGPPKTVDLTLGSVSVPSVRYLSPYAPTVSDTVIVDLAGNDPLVIGKLA